jgi:hypothetical protein
MGVKLKRIIINWERSGQGDGGLDDEGSEEQEDSMIGEDTPGFGALANRKRGALDQRSQFVDYQQSYLLYLWFMLDKHGLLESSIQRLDDSVAACNGATGVPQVIDVASLTSSKSKRKCSKSESPSTASQNDLQALSESIASLVDVARMDAQEKAKHHDIERMRVDRSFAYQREEKIRDGIDNLRIEKRKLAVTMVEYLSKKNKLAADILQQQIDEINMETKEKEKQLEDPLANR